MGRPKQPDLLRQSLLDHAITLAATQGVAALTTDAVARAAGVSKGGLFHHFPNKPALIAGVVAHMIDRIDAAVTARLDPDPARPGRFTRAYIAVLLDQGESGLGPHWSALSMSMLADPAMQQLWEDWIAARLAAHAATDGGADLAILRLAADGLWLGQATGAGQGLPVADLLPRLAAWVDRVAPAAP